MDTQSALIIVAIAVFILAGAFFALSSAFNREGRSASFIDEDADGEPDESSSEKARALESLADERLP